MTRTILEGKGGKDGKESTQLKQNQRTIKSYGEAMDLMEQLKLFCAEKNLTFMEDVVEIKAKMTSVTVNSSSVRPNWKVSSSIKWQHTRKQILKRLFKQPPTSLKTAF